MKNHLTRGFSFIIAAGMLTFGFTFGQPVHASTATRPARLTSVTLQLKWVPQAQFAGYFVAKDKGFYRAQGLDVTIKAGGPQIAPEEVVQSGGADFGIDWLSALLQARDTGLQLQNIAQIFQASGMRLITLKSSGITTVRQFKGRTVGVWPSGNQYQFYALMHKIGYSPPQKYMNVAQEGFTMDDFLNHKLDVAHAMTYNELGVVLEHGIKLSQLRIFDYNKLGVSILEDGLFVKSSWSASHKDIIVKFLKASIQGWQWAVQHPAAAGQISFSQTQSGTTTLFHQKYMMAQVAKLILYGAGKTHTIGYMDPALWHRTWGTLFRENIIHHPPTAGAYTQVYWKAAGGH
jgi:NitT/TauT family transport system substrate-binding protein